MNSIKNTPLIDTLLKEFNYDFGNVFVFDGYIVSEINEGVTFTWDHHASLVVNDVTGFLGTYGGDLIYISHRIHSYSVMPNDWIKFFRHSYSLRGYGVVGYTNGSLLNTVIENLFFTKKIKRFNNLIEAVQWATNDILVEVED
nr:hypothetical protein [uncultured Psychroserpens sp.]